MIIKYILCPCHNNCMSILMGRSSNKAEVSVNNDQIFVNELNHFHCRFDSVGDRTNVLIYVKIPLQKD